MKGLLDCLYVSSLPNKVRKGLMARCKAAVCGGGMAAELRPPYPTR